MKKLYIYLLFGLMVLAQIVASAQIVYKYESIISPENAYKFKTAPIDPNDPFRGKFITLRFEINEFNTNDENWEYGDKAYAYFSSDENGFAILETLSKTKLTNSELAYVEVKTTSHYNGVIHFSLPFNRYYMEETKANDAETLYRKRNRRGERKNAYALVYLKNGTHTLTDVIIDGVSIKDAVEK
ncbi:MAG: GDYXXLXY domain-containing protein [Kordia sp.]|uniref:GDYXXLXY domain-containing protein n=1 Tax=Kordia sp. TaxID=1965332 RepID=UPI00385E6295